MKISLVMLFVAQFASPAFGATLREMIAGRDVRCCTDGTNCHRMRFNAKATSVRWVREDSETWAISWERGGNASIFTQPSFPTEPGTFLVLKAGQIGWDGQVCNVVQ